MKQQAVNPYLPLDEYVPAGEPRVFEDRLYIFGSHDRSHGRKFCMNDYVGWFAPCNNLADRTETIICFMDMEAENRRKSGKFMWPCAISRLADINIMGRLICLHGKKGIFLLTRRFWWMMTNVSGCITDSGRETGGREIKGAAVQLWNWLQI